MITQVYTKKQAAEILGISERTIHALVLAGKLRSTKIGRSRRFTEGHINELIKNGEY